jgi:NAD(P)H-dependent flavin oxidoreductase YrpB (nitropropane dioxygenase family)
MTASSYKVGTIELQFILGATLVKLGLSAPSMQALAEAKATEAAGAETIIAPGMDARGHRGAFGGETILIRAFSGKLGQSIATDYVRAALGTDAPSSAAYPVQRGLTAPMRLEAQKNADVQRMQAWAGQSAALASAESALAVIKRVWKEAEALLTNACFPLDRLGQQ